MAQQCREFARLAVVNGDTLVWLAHAQGAAGGLLYQPFLTSNTVPLYATASGKAWLATLKTEQAVENVLRNGGFEDADRYGPNAIRSIETLGELTLTAGGVRAAVNGPSPGPALQWPFAPRRDGDRNGELAVQRTNVGKTPPGMEPMA